MTVKTYIRGAYQLVLDSSQVVPDDPGAGAPAMVYGPKGSSASFWCAMDTGELSDRGGIRELPDSIVVWLVAMAGTVDDFIHDHEKGSAA